MMQTVEGTPIRPRSIVSAKHLTIKGRIQRLTMIGLNKGRYVSEQGYDYNSDNLSRLQDKQRENTMGYGYGEDPDKRENKAWRLLHRATSSNSLGPLVDGSSA